MQITIMKTDEPGTDEVFTLVVADREVHTCGVCADRRSAWRVDDASEAAMNPAAASPIGTPDVCTVCLNDMLDHGTITVTNVDPDTF